MTDKRKLAIMWLLTKEVDSMNAIKLPPEFENFEIPEILIKRIKIGLYKGLFKKGLISQKQLDMLIKMQNIPIEEY